MSINLKNNVSEIVDFALKYSGYYKGIERNELYKYAELHISYGTLLWIPGIALARWNVLPNPKVIHVIDLIIHPDFRGLKQMRSICLEIWKRNPQVESFYYDRIKYGERSSYGFSVKHWFKLKEKSRHERKER